MRPPGAAILCYHGVTGPRCPSSNITNIPFEEIARTLTRLRTDREIIPLSELLRRHSGGRSLAGLAAVTFDDAYLSLADLLSPWLHQQGIPYSIFVVTGASRNGAAFWWDRVDDLFPKLGLDRWRAFEESLGLPESFRAGQPAAFGPVRPLRQYILSRFQGHWPPAFEEELAELEREVGWATVQRPMTFTELDAVAARGGVEFGVHTCTHPVLPLLPDAELVAEVRECLDELRKRYRVTIPVLAIPFGLFDARTLRLASEAGVDVSLTMANRLVPNGELRLGAPRISITKSVPLWKRRLQWFGITENVRRALRWGRSTDGYPALPSATT
jgi:peptidoglycan/xylan/chitin deacetylase (PgdA/CDA1 family)